jgi:hypothetical protein
MSGPALKPRVARLENGWRPEVVIADLWGNESVFCGHTAPTHAEALALARRLISTATVEEPPVEVEVREAWR